MKNQTEVLKSIVLRIDRSCNCDLFTAECFSAVNACYLPARMLCGPLQTSADHKHAGKHQGPDLNVRQPAAQGTNALQTPQNAKCSERLIFSGQGSSAVKAHQQRQQRTQRQHHLKAHQRSSLISVDGSSAVKAHRRSKPTSGNDNSDNNNNNNKDLLSAGFR